LQTMGGPTPLTLPIGSTENSVRVHPVVLFTICDAYIRRNKGQERVIGTLLGTIGDGIVDIQNCYAVPHIETNEQVRALIITPCTPTSLLIWAPLLPLRDLQVAVDVVHHQTMANLQQKVNPRERVVGWFSTGVDVTGPDALIHSFYAGECPSPVHLIVDTTLQNNKMAIRAFSSREFAIQGRELAREFQEVPCEVRSIEAERAGAELLSAELAEKLPSSAEGLASTLEKLQHNLEAAHRYVTEVVEGKRAGSATVGRHLAETVASVPRFSKDELTKLATDSQNDVLLTSYLAGLIKAHIALADKLGTMQLPLV
jgi:translation initiation factor 3 subunit F